MLYNFLIKYPFSNKAKLFLESKNINLFSVDEKILKKAALFILKTINLKHSEQEKQWHNYLRIDDKVIAELFVELYPISKILLNIVDNAQLKQQFAVYYQRQLKYYLNNLTEENELDDVIYDLCPFVKSTEDGSYYFSILDFLSLDIGEDYKLQYSNLNNGYLYFDKKEIIYFLSVVLKKKILKMGDLNLKDVPKIFMEYAEYIKKEILKNTKFKISIFKKPKIGEFPPCFQKLYDDLLSGKKLTHIGNFSLAVFLYNINYTYDEILNVFKNSPNFNEKIASYQIKKILEKKYSVSNCETMRVNNLCVKECGVKHPLLLLKDKVKKNDRK